MIPVLHLPALDEGVQEGRAHGGEASGVEMARSMQEEEGKHTQAEASCSRYLLNNGEAAGAEIAAGALSRLAPSAASSEQGTGGQIPMQTSWSFTMMPRTRR